MQSRGRCCSTATRSASGCRAVGVAAPLVDQDLKAVGAVTLLCEDGGRVTSDEAATRLVPSCRHAQRAQLAEQARVVVGDGDAAAAQSMASRVAGGDQPRSAHVPARRGAPRVGEGKERLAMAPGWRRSAAARRARRPAGGAPGEVGRDGRDAPARAGERRRGSRRRRQRRRRRAPATRAAARRAAERRRRRPRAVWCGRTARSSSTGTSERWGRRRWRERRSRSSPSLMSSRAACRRRRLRRRTGRSASCRA